MIDNLLLQKWTEQARRDDWHMTFVGSDIRVMLGEIGRERAFAAPGAADFTFGSMLSEMIRRAFQRVDGRLQANGRTYTECLHCQGTDFERDIGARPSLELVEHKPDCLLAKHMPRLKAMANRDVT